jgi:hypothetical protein
MARVASRQSPNHRFAAWDRLLRTVALRRVAYSPSVIDLPEEAGIETATQRGWRSAREAIDASISLITAGASGFFARRAPRSIRSVLALGDDAFEPEFACSRMLPIVIGGPGGCFVFHGHSVFRGATGSDWRSTRRVSIVRTQVRCSLMSIPRIAISAQGPHIRPSSSSMCSGLGAIGCWRSERTNHRISRVQAAARYWSRSNALNSTGPTIRERGQITNRAQPDMNSPQKPATAASPVGVVGEVGGF